MSSTLISLKFHAPLSAKAPLQAINKDETRNSSQEIIKRPQAHRQDKRWELQRLHKQEAEEAENSQLYLAYILRKWFWPKLK